MIVAYIVENVPSGAYTCWQDVFVNIYYIIDVRGGGAGARGCSPPLFIRTAVTPVGGSPFMPVTVLLSDLELQLHMKTNCVIY